MIKIEYIEASQLRRSLMTGGYVHDVTYFPGTKHIMWQINRWITGITSDDSRVSVPIDTTPPSLHHILAMIERTKQTVTIYAVSNSNLVGVVIHDWIE